MYTEKEVEKMISIYTANPCLETVEKLMVLLNKPKKSIISKLVKEGVYIKRGYVTKTGENPISKIELVRCIEDALDIKCMGLDKTPKSTLKILCDAIVEQTEFLEDSLVEISNYEDELRLRQEIRQSFSRKENNPLEILSRG